MARFLMFIQFTMYFSVTLEVYNHGKKKSKISQIIFEPDKVLEDKLEDSIVGLWKCVNNLLQFNKFDVSVLCYISGEKGKENLHGVDSMTHRHEYNIL